jgi:hypothetical protein
MLNIVRLGFWVLRFEGLGSLVEGFGHLGRFRDARNLEIQCLGFWGF